MNKEKQLSIIYHKFWGNFTIEQFNKSAELFIKRLEHNEIKLDMFKNKICLDAGCGSGRYIKAMLDLKAKHITGIDLNPEIAKKFIKNNSKVTIIKNDLRKIPYKNEYFDFICCNGVLHHLTDPNKVIKELLRVLKKDGFMFIYVFDNDSFDWEILNSLRKAISKYNIQRTSNFFKKLFNAPENKLFNFCDLLYAPIQNKYTKKELKKMFPDCNLRFLTKPYTSYDRENENRFIVKKQGEENGKQTKM